MTRPHDAAVYEFCLALFTELGAAGVEHVVVSPGYRSAPLAIGAHRAGLGLTVQIDERVGG